MKDRCAHFSGRRAVFSSVVRLPPALATLSAYMLLGLLLSLVLSPPIQSQEQQSHWQNFEEKVYRVCLPLQLLGSS
jgi:hypothetical protein